MTLTIYPELEQGSDEWLAARAGIRCAIEGCSKPVRARGWCVTHYDRWLRHGDSNKTFYIHGNPKARFWVKVNKDAPAPAHRPALGACWEWIAAKTNDGYGIFRLDGKIEKAHRVSYKFAHGDIPLGKELDHMCRNRACVRPSHLRAVTGKENAEHRNNRGAHSSGYRGVYWHKVSGKWAVCVYHNGDRHHGGHFLDVDEAGRVARDIRNMLYTHNDMDRTTE